ncbi:GrpB family protein [Devosia sp. YR412]|uniref:GrpB family protein n=1 Tax=Devosia sp. YR412 TaxID=1881030 RepID=UPI000B8780F9|nr:GrpB family protein [Devosia sp. YR412]
MSLKVGSGRNIGTDFGLGLRQGMVELVPHNPSWTDAYDLEASEIRHVLGSRFIEIEHIGSTAIAGIRAKPILDIMVGIEDFSSGPLLEPMLAKLGYDYARNAGVPHDHVFGKGEERTHLVHVVEFDGAVWHHNLRFRDALRSDPTLAARYEDLKVRLSGQFQNNRAAYTAAKREFIDLVAKRP